MTEPQTELAKREVDVTEVFTRNKKAKKPVICNEGGADSSKSYSLAQLFIYKYNNERDKSFLVCCKTLPHLRISAYKLVISLMKDYDYYSRLTHNKSERTLYNPANNNLMLFTSIDDPEKIKSAEFNYIWMEEAGEFNYEDFIILKLRLRAKTTPKKPNRIYLSYNPVDEYGWINQQLKSQPDVQVIHSTVDDNLFAQDADIAVLDGLKGQDASYYMIYRLGKYAKIKGRIHELEMVDVFPECPETIYGLDFGYTNPNALVQLDIDIENMALYLTELHYQTGQTNSDLIDSLKVLIPEEHRKREIYGDSAEPARIEEIYEAGFNIHASDKSVKDGIDFVNRFKLYCKEEYTNLKGELRGYKRKVDKNNHVMEEPVKFRDHCPNALRYAVYTHLRERLLETEPAWTVSRKTKIAEVVKLGDEDVRQAAIDRIKESGFLSLFNFSRSLGHMEDAMRVKLLALGFEEIEQNRFVYGKALEMQPPKGDGDGKGDERDEDSWTV